AGDDGDLRRGAPLSYTDNGDGTVTDNNTGLMWEKKDALDASPSASDLHDADNAYPWGGTCSSGGASGGTGADCANGTCDASDGPGTGYTIFKWVAALNTANFAGHNDWRIPNAKELQSIVDYGVPASIDPAFGPTHTTGYWTSSSCLRCDPTQF